MAVEVERVAVKAAGDLEAIVDESQDKGMEVPTCRSYGKQRAGWEEVKDLEEELDSG